MNNFLKRLILTVVAVPLIIFSLFWPLNSHIILIIIYGLFVTVLGSFEFSSLIFEKKINIRKFFLPSVNLSILTFAYIYANNYFNFANNKFSLPIFFALLVGISSFVLSRDIFKTDLKKSFEKIAYTFTGIIYIGVPSFLMPFIFNIKIGASGAGGTLPLFINISGTGTMTGSLLATYFIVLVFANDIFAYVSGMLFGRSNVIGLTASPKKSWAGYIGGFIAGFFWVGIFYFIFKKFETNLPLWVFFSFPLLSGIFVPIGDLVESVIKRSADVKDSGFVILGRGGVLDSVDTILFLIPIFFIYLQICFAII